MSEHDEIIKEMAVKHGVAVARNDPILILETLHKRLLEDTMRRYKEDFEALSKRWADETKAKAEKILTVALAESQEMMRKAAQESSSIIAAEVRKEIGNNLGPLQAMRVLVIANIVACAVTMGAAFLVLLAK